MTTTEELLNNNARSRAWRLGASEREAAHKDERRERTVIDIDATLTTAHSEKEQAAGNFKRGYGHHPLLCYLDDSEEALAGILRPGNAGSNTASDHKLVLDLALGQLDREALEGEILVRGDGAGATHELCLYCREGQMLFSFGFDLTEPVLEAIGQMPESAWVKAIRADGSEREHSQCEAYASSFDKADLPLPPGRKVAVVACMDARLNVYGALGLHEGDAHVIRNAGGVVTDDEIRSLAISQRLLGTEEIILIHHTDCGMPGPSATTSSGARSNRTRGSSRSGPPRRSPTSIPMFASQSRVSRRRRSSRARIRSAASSTRSRPAGYAR